jgi:hypothetical protein
MSTNPRIYFNSITPAEDWGTNLEHKIEPIQQGAAPISWNFVLCNICVVDARNVLRGSVQTCNYQLLNVCKLHKAIYNYIS